MIHIYLFFFIYLKPLTIGNNEDDGLPVPKIGVAHLKPGTITVDWLMTRLPPNNYKLTHSVISIVGTEFITNSIKSDASYECLMESNGEQLPAVQHCWITRSSANLDNKFTIDGIVDTSIYQ